MNIRKHPIILSIQPIRARRVGWLLASVLTLTLTLSAPGAIRVHFYDRLGESQVAETLTLTIVGPGISKQLCLRLVGDQTDGYLTVTLPDGGQYAILIQTETRFREQGVERIVMSTGEVRLILRGGETFEVVADLSRLPGVSRFREKGASELLPPITIDPPVLPELPVPSKENSTSNATTVAKQVRNLRGHANKKRNLHSGPIEREAVTTR